MVFNIKLLILLTFLSINNSFATIKIGVLDSGLDIEDPRLKPYLCKEGHKDFTGEGLIDYHGHGTHVVGLITQFAGHGDYCLIIAKYYSPKINSAWPYLNALEYLIKLNVDIINISGGGSIFFPSEERLIQNAKNTVFIVAAGNDSVDLDITTKYQYYPACIKSPNILVVGNLKRKGIRHEDSNYGKIVKYWEIGTHVLSTVPNNDPYAIEKYNKYGFMTGTSMSCAIYTGKIVKELVNEIDN